MRPFAELGALVERRWRDKDYDEHLFPGIAAQALLESNLSGRIDPWEIVGWLHATPSLPRQMDLKAEFGDPPLTLFTGPRFHIDVYYWLDGTTSIHQHKFSGAFQVLLGSSVHAQYRFEKTREINPRLLAGKLLLNDVSLLRVGDIREIVAGPQFIHSLFHLERPSATITVRTYTAPGAGVQYNYSKPFLARDPFFKDPLLIRKVQTVSLLLSMRHPDADGFIGKLVDTSDFETTYFVLGTVFEALCHRQLEEIFGLSRGYDRLQPLLERARSRHGELADLLLPVFEEEWRQTDISLRRAKIKGEEHRFLLALLLNVPDRATVLRLVHERFPDQDAVELVVRWIREMRGIKIFGSPEPSVLGVGGFDDSHLIVLRGLLEGLAVEEIKTREASESRLAAELTSSVDDMASQIKALPLFSSIFTEQ